MNYNWTIFWNGRPYHSGQVSLDFIVWLVGNEKFTLICEGEELREACIHPDGIGYGWWAVDYDRYEPGSVYGNHSTNSRTEALEGLIENVSESILSKVKVA